MFRNKTAAKKFTIAVIPARRIRKSVNAGMKAAADAKARSRCRSDMKGPLREDDREQQIQVVEGFVSQGVMALCWLRPTARRWFVRPKELGADPNAIIDSASNPIR